MLYSFTKPLFVCFLWFIVIKISLSILSCLNSLLFIHSSKLVSKVSNLNGAEILLSFIAYLAYRMFSHVKKWTFPNCQSKYVYKSWSSQRQWHCRAHNNLCPTLHKITCDFCLWSSLWAVDLGMNRKTVTEQ